MPVASGRSDIKVVVDGNLITSRKPDDLPTFCREIVRALAKAAQPRSAAPGSSPAAPAQTREGAGTHLRPAGLRPREGVTA